MTQYRWVTRKNPQTGKSERVLLAAPKASALENFMQVVGGSSPFIKLNGQWEKRSQANLNALAAGLEKKHGFDIYGYGTPRRVVTRNGTRNPAAPKPNPLDEAVNSAISGMVKPWETGVASVGAQQDYLTDLGSRSSAGLQTQLSGLAAEGIRNSDQMMASAAAANDAQGAALQKQMDFLKSVAGHADQSAIDASAVTAANTFDNRNLATELALRQASMTEDDRARQQIAAVTGTEWARNAQQPLAAMKAQMAGQIAAIQAQAPALRREWGNQDREFQLKQDELKFQREQFAQAIKQWNSEFNEGVRQFDKNAEIQQQGLDLEGNDAASSSSSSAAENLSKWREKVGAQVNDATSLFSAASADPVAYRQLYQSFPKGTIPYKVVTNEAGQKARVLDLNAWRKMPIGTKAQAMLKFFKSKGLPPGWSFIAALQYIPGAKEQMLKAATNPNGTRYILDAHTGQMRALKQGEKVPVYYNTLRTY